MNNVKKQTVSTANLLIERNYHYCRIKNFANSISTQFSSEDQTQQDNLLLCKDLEINKKLSYLDGHKKMIKFCQHIR